MQNCKTGKRSLVRLQYAPQCPPVTPCISEEGFLILTQIPELILKLNFIGITNASILFKVICHSNFNIDEAIVTIFFTPELSKQGSTQI